MTALTPEAFLQRVHQQPPGDAAETIARLRQLSVRVEGVQADPLAQPDPSSAMRRPLQVLMAGNQLHVGLVTAALRRLTLDGVAETPDRSTHDGMARDGVTDYVEQAGGWIEAVTDALARRWGVGPRADPTVAGAALTGYHRYELGRTLVAALGDWPELPERVESERMAAYLAAPAAVLPPAPPARDYVSAGGPADRALAWSRALAVVLEAAVDAPFERPLDTVLADARVALTEAMANSVAAFDAAFSTPADARPIVEQHALQTSARLYAATLRHVHRESARMIERYQALQHSGPADEADRLARDYQERRLGYAGVPHHFQALRAIHAAQQDAALSVLAAMASKEQPEAVESAESDRRIGRLAPRGRSNLTP